jgi:transcriptional regulator with XRE-family HTH domain
MQQQGLTVRGAASAAGVARSTVQDWRSGVQPTDFLAVQKLAVALGTSLSFLLTGTDETRPGGAATVDEDFEEDGLVFEGYCHISIRRLLPREAKPASDARDDIHED